MKEKRDTVGKISSELAQKDPETRDPIEIQREVHKGYEDHIYECIERCKLLFPYDFYVVVSTKKERLMPNVLRNYYMGRQSCPTPECDQTVYLYHRLDAVIEFLWVVPSKDTCELFMRDALKVIDEEKPLLQFVLDFYDGTLMNLSKKLNRERADSPLIM